MLLVQAKRNTFKMMMEELPKKRMLGLNYELLYSMCPE